MVTYLSPSQINSIPFCNFTITGIIKPHTPAVACDTLVCDAEFFLPPTQPLSTATYFRYSILLSATSLHLHLHPTAPMAVVYNPPFHCSTSQPALCFGPTGLARSSSCGGETCTLCDVAFLFSSNNCNYNYRTPQRYRSTVVGGSCTMMYHHVPLFTLYYIYP
jgi:hypothetical protein